MLHNGILAALIDNDVVVPPTQHDGVPAVHQLLPRLVPRRVGHVEHPAHALNRDEAFIEPLVAWLDQHGVKLLTNAFVRDIGFAPSPGRITVNRLDYERDSGAAPRLRSGRRISCW
jgi:MCRA family